MRQSLFDQYQRLFPRSHKSDPAIVVAIDERALETYGQWPWPRTLIAELTERTAALGALAIGFDVLFPEPDRFSPRALSQTLKPLPADVVRRLDALPSNDQRFANAMRNRRVVLSVAANDAVDPHHVVALPGTPVRYFGDAARLLPRFQGYVGNVAELRAAAAGQGLISVDASDTNVRRVHLLADIGDVTVPGLALELLRVATGVPALNVYARGSGLLDVGLGDVRIPIQEDGIFWLYYSREVPGRLVSAADVLAGRVAPGLLKDKIALVGVTGLGLLDYKTSPFGEKVAGVELHAQLIEQVFDGAYLVRPHWTLWTELALLALAAMVLAAIVPRRHVAISIGTLIGLLATLAAIGTWAFAAHGVLLDIAWPSIGAVICFGALLTNTLAEADRQRRALREAAARVAGELEAARRIQMGLLPQPREVFRGERGFELEGLVEPAQSVGGDFYDCLKLDPDRLFFVVGDVSGKGMPAALFMALSKSIVRAAAARGGRSLGTIVSQAAEEIERQNPESLFVTLFAAILDLRTGMLEYCNAGHPPPYARLPSGAVERFPAAEGPPLCVLPNFEYETGYRQLRPGEWVCAVTDGVTEATDPATRFYGTDRLVAAIARLPKDVQASDVANELREDVRRFAGGSTQSDDLTLLAVRWITPVA